MLLAATQSTFSWASQATHTSEEQGKGKEDIKGLESVIINPLNKEMLFHQKKKEEMGGDYLCKSRSWL